MSRRRSAQRPRQLPVRPRQSPYGEGSVPLPSRVTKEGYIKAGRYGAQSHFCLGCKQIVYFTTFNGRMIERRKDGTPHSPIICAQESESV